MAKNIAACLTFDFDAISLWLGGFRATSLSAVSRGEFGRVGAVRLLTMLREWKIPSTWFVPGHSAETFPEIARQIAAEGHEIGNHGYFHSRPKSPEDEERILIRGNETSRAGAEALSRIMAADLRGTGVTVNMLLPGGATRTGMVPEDVHSIPGRSLLDPAIMGPPIVWLASADADGVHDERLVATEFDGWLRRRRPEKGR